MPDAVSRFADIADVYDASRPVAPEVIAEVLMQWTGVAAPDVADVGAGTGLSAMMWRGRARTLVAVEPGDAMRAAARRRLGLAADGVPEGGFSTIAGAAEATGLPGGSADIVTASQAMHWFDAARALPEVVRVLRPGGVFAAFDCDWPPVIDWETDAAYLDFGARVHDLEKERGLTLGHAGKRHLKTLRDSGLFRFATEVALHSEEQGDDRRLIDLALSQGGTEAVLRSGASEEEIGLTALREVAARRLAQPRPWWWTYRVRLAVK